MLLALGAGVLATLLASLPPLIDLRASRPADAVFREIREEAGSCRGTAFCGWRRWAWSIILAVTVLVLSVPQLTVLGGMALALAAIALIPAIFVTVVGVLARVGRAHPGQHAGDCRDRAALDRDALDRAGRRGGAGRLRQRRDRRRQAGPPEWHRRRELRHYFSTADIWVVNGDDIFNTNEIHRRWHRRRRSRDTRGRRRCALPGGAAGRRRAQALGARESPGRSGDARSQPARERQPRTGHRAAAAGWLGRDLRASFAGEHHLRVGSYLSLPTPSGSVRFGVAAITTNLGVAAGLRSPSTASDYSRYWQTTDPSALEVDIKPGVALGRARRSRSKAHLATPGPAGAHERRTGTPRARPATRQGLQNLGEIATLLLIAAALSVASALGAVIWQRRAKLASLRIQGFDYRQLWRALLLESLILLSIGSIDGVLLGVYGHALASRWLQLTTGFSAPFSLAGLQILETFLLVAGMALAVIAVPGLRAAKVPASMGLQE